MSAEARRFEVGGYARVINAMPESEQGKLYPIGSIFKIKEVGTYLTPDPDQNWTVPQWFCQPCDPPQEDSTPFNASGSKYLRPLVGAVHGQGCMVDVYAILKTFDVRCPARQHAIKKLLCAGLRGKASEQQDLKEARDAVDRAMQLADVDGEF